MNQWRNRSLGAFVAMSLFFAFTLGAQDTSTEKAVAYLVSEQDEEGGWNQDKQKRIVDSLESFRALQRVRGGETALNNALKYFSALSEDNNVTLSAKLQILSNSTADITSLAAKLISLQKTDGGWGLVESKRGSVPHTLLAVNALLSSKKASSEVLSRACKFLASSQKDSGEWIFSGEYSLSDVAHTAMTLTLLKQIQSSGSFSNTELEQAITRARSYLESKYNAGSYGDLLDTAWVYLAFSQIKQPSELQATLTLITNSQKSNGSWNDKIYDTAICLQALTAIQVPQSDLPDLEITEQNISFNPNAPLTGNEVTVSATIFNTGKLDAENVKVEFFNRDPRLGGTPLGTIQTIALIPAGGSAIAKTSFTTENMVGAEQIVVFVDRDNNINEITKTNNAAAKILTVGGMPDLAVFADDITLSNPNPKAFETVDLIVTIHNTGNEAVQNIPIKIYDNDQLLSEFILSGVNAGSTNKGIVTTGFSAENHTIRVAVDPDHTIASEINLANNSASKSFMVEAEPEKPADLAVESLTTTPSVPLTIEPTTITVNLVNLGGVDITTAFNVVLSVDGTAVGTIAVPQLLKGQRASLSFENLTLAAGERTITATADGANAVTEDTNRANNTLTKTITVKDGATPAELELVSITATPSTANVNATVSFKVLVRNNGTAEAANVDVKLFNGNVALNSGITVPKLIGGQSAELIFEHAFDTNGSYSIRAVVDPNNKIAEPNESNNEKSATVTVAGAADLEITAANILFSADTVNAFEEFTITAVVKNLGNQAAVNVPVRFLANGEILATLNLSGVNAGSSNRAILTTSLPKGTYNITVQIDPDKTLSNEHDYTNNTAYRTLEVKASETSGADLAVEKLSFNPVLPIQGTATNISATVINAGGTDIETPFSVEIKDGTTVLHTFTVPALAAGQRTNITLTANLPAGEHSITVTADSGNVVTETNKNNNTISRSVTVESSASPADLTVTVSCDKTAPNVMDKVTFSAVIANGGTTDAGSFLVRILVNGAAIGDDYTISALPGGGTFHLQIPYTVTQEGANTVQVIADVQNNIVESNESNNTGTLTFTATTIPRPDLTIPTGGLQLNPTTPQPGVPFTLNITVGNIGNSDAAASKLRITEGNPQTVGAASLAEVAIPAIEAGKQAVVGVSLKLEAGKEIFIFVDSNDEIAESREDNNLFNTNIPVQALPDLIVDAASLSVSHTDLEKGQFVKLTGIVNNLGTLAASASKLRLIIGEGETAVQLALLDIPAIEAGGSYEFETLWAPARGASTLTVLVDAENSITEASEENNSTEKSFTFTMPNSEMKLYRVESDGEYQTEEFYAGQYQKVKVIHSYPETYIIFQIFNPQGTMIEGTRDIILEANEFGWDTGSYPPCADGEYYKAVATIVSKTIGPVETVEKLFVIKSSSQILYAAPVANPNNIISGRTLDVALSSNIMFVTNSDATFTARFKLSSPSGTELFSDTTAFEATRLISQKVIEYPTFNYEFSESGDYPMLLEILKGDEIVYTKSGKITVLPEIRVKVTKTITPEVLPAGPEGQVKVEIKVQGTRN